MTERPIQTGDLLLGYCGGHFGRDSYENKVVEAVGKDWVVARDAQGAVHTAEFSDRWDVDCLVEFRFREPEAHD